MRDKPEDEQRGGGKRIARGDEGKGGNERSETDIDTRRETRIRKIMEKKSWS